MKKSVPIILLAMTVLLSGCSDPKEKAIANVKNGCVLSQGDSAKADELCGCLANAFVDKLDDDEINILNKDMESLSVDEQRKAKDIFAKIATLDYNQCVVR